MTTTAPESPSSYTIVLPPGWIRVSLAGTTKTAVKDLADRIFQRIPRDEALDTRRDIEAQLTDMVQKAKAGNGLDLYVPTEPMHGRIVAASFIVGGVMLPEEIDGLESLVILGDLATDGNPVEVDGELGVRAERMEAARRDTQRGGRQPTCGLCVPRSG